MENFNFNTPPQTNYHNAVKAKSKNHFDLDAATDSDLSLTTISNTRPQDLVNFKSEFNIGLALPFEFCKNNKQEKFEKHSMTKWFDENGNMNRLEVIFRGNSGAAGKTDQDVLNILMSMCVEQKTDSPIFTYEDIRRRLGLAKGSHGNIRDSIRRMLDMKIEFKKSFYTANGSKNLNAEKHLIQSRKSVINEDFSDFQNIDARHSVTFDQDIMNNLLSGYYSVLNRETYLSLESGAVRRLYQLIVANRDVGQKNIFTLEVDDIASVLGLTKKKDFYSNVKKYFEALKIALPNLEYTFATINRKKVAKISFPDNHLLTNNDEFFDSLVKWYGADVIDSNEITYQFLQDLRARFPTKIEYDKTKVLLCELYLDMIFYQKINNKSQIQSIKALLFSSLSKKDYVRPDGYKKFVVERIKHREIVETKELALQEEEKKKYELQVNEKKTKELAAMAFTNIKNTNPKTYDKYVKEARRLYGEEIESNLLGDQILEEKVKELIQNRMESGEQIIL
jgi:hypothetical protein